MFNLNHKKIIFLKDCSIIFIGCLLLGVSFNAFFDRFGMAPGGLSGLFVIINHVFHMELWISNLAFNIPLYILAFRLLSKEECIKTLCGILFCSVGFRATLVFSNMNITDNEVVACILGGICLGSATGIIFKVGGSTGGTGLMAILINRCEFAKKISVPKIMGVADGIVILLSFFTSGKLTVGIYSAVALFIVVFVSDRIVGMKKNDGLQKKGDKNGTN